MAAKSPAMESFSVLSLGVMDPLYQIGYCH